MSNHEAFERTAKRLREHTRKNGQNMTQQQAKKIVREQLIIAENKRKRG
tara:strand:+ start:2702 stop:2848 length:147 start_codon:yes stop_codon:yes gene_type:complete